MNKRFSILFLLTLTFAIAAILAGFRYGSQQGYDHGEQEWHNEMPSSIRHPLHGIELAEDISDEDWPGEAKEDRRTDLVIWMVTEKIAPDQWEAMGGPFSIQHDEQRDELAVFASKAIQDEIAALINDLSASPDSLNRFAREKLLELKERARLQEERVRQQLQPATQLIAGPFEVLNRDAILAGRYSVTMAKSAKPMIAHVDFFPNPDEAGVVTHGGVKIQYKNEGEHPPLSQSFQVWGGGRIQIGATYYSAGTIDENLILVSENEPKEILVLSSQPLPVREQTDEREPE